MAFFGATFEIAKALAVAQSVYCGATVAYSCASNLYTAARMVRSVGGWCAGTLPRQLQSVVGDADEYGIVFRREALEDTPAEVDDVWLLVSSSSAASEPGGTECWQDIVPVSSTPAEIDQITDVCAFPPVTTSTSKKKTPRPPARRVEPHLP